MRTIDRYRFELIAEWIESGEEVKDVIDVNPILNKMEVKYSRPSNEMYYEKTFDSDFRLIGRDFEWVMSKSVSTRFTLTVISKKHNDELARCNFRKSDCEIDVNHREVHIKPKADNPYELLKGKLDDEIDIKPLMPSMNAISYLVRPAMQIYRCGSSKITTITRYNSQQNDVSSQTDHDTIKNAGFGSIRFMYARAIVTRGNSILGDSFELKSSNFIDKSSQVIVNQIPMTSSVYVGSFAILNRTSVTSPYAYLRLTTPDSQNHDISLVDKSGNLLNFGSNSIDGTIFSVNGGTSANITFEYNRVQCEIHIEGLTCVDLYFRGLTAYAHTSSSDAYRKIIEGNDIFTHGVYKFAYSSPSIRPSLNELIATLDTTNEITEYGKASVDKYYSKPTTTDTIDPVGQDLWNGGASVWIKSQFVLERTDSILYSRTLSPGNWYSFGGALKAVLQKLDDRIDFEETEEYSKFLFAEDNPVLSTGVVTFKQGRLYMLQKSNILSLDYDVASNNNKITLRKMLQFLKYALNCYWHFQSYIDDNGDTRYKFHVEHVYYYMNGGAYIGSDSRSVIDLTKMKDSANGVLLSKNTNRWSYDVGSGNGTATKIQYHWMDKESPAFNGYDMDVPEESRILSDDTLEERTIDWFSSDIDYLLANADECSKDGFLIVWTRSISGNEVPIDNNESSPTYNMQNYRLAIAWLQQHILLYNIGSKYVKINNKSFNNAIRGVKPMRKANVKFIPIDDVTPDFKVNTEAGEGVINSMTIDMTCGLVSADLLYELED